MKNRILFIGFFFLSANIFAQVTEEELILVHPITQVQLDALVTTTNGKLVFNTSDNHLYLSDGANWQRLILDKAIVKTITSDYTLLANDSGQVINVSSANPVTLTVPSGLDIGFNVSVYQLGAGKITFVGSGVTLKNRLQRFISAGVDAGIGIVCTSNNIFHVTGDLRR